MASSVMIFVCLELFEIGAWRDQAQAAMAYQKTAALMAAVKLDVFTLIGGGTTTSELLSEKTDTSSRGRISRDRCRSPHTREVALATATNWLALSWHEQPFRAIRKRRRAAEGDE